jgi:hypothetical protein
MLMYASMSSPENDPSIKSDTHKAFDYMLGTISCMALSGNIMLSISPDLFESRATATQSAGEVRFSGGMPLQFFKSIQRGEQVTISVDDIRSKRFSPARCAYTSLNSICPTVEEYPLYVNFKDKVREVPLSFDPIMGYFIGNKDSFPVNMDPNGQKFIGYFESLPYTMTAQVIDNDTAIVPLTPELIALREN